MIQLARTEYWPKIKINEKFRFLFIKKIKIKNTAIKQKMKNKPGMNRHCTCRPIQLYARKWTQLNPTLIGHSIIFSFSPDHHRQIHHTHTIFAEQKQLFYDHNRLEPSFSFSRMICSIIWSLITTFWPHFLIKVVPERPPHFLRGLKFILLSLIQSFIYNNELN